MQETHQIQMITSQQNGSPNPPSQPPNTSYNNMPLKTLITYKECLKNHAASIGGNALDGCGEFMPSSEPFKCSACGCHRNFHRKEVEGENHHIHNNAIKRRTNVNSMHHHKDTLLGHFGSGSIPVNVGSDSTLSESNDDHGGRDGFGIRPVEKKKRFRTKFSVDQKEKLLDFADKAGWKMQKLDECVVQQFCHEIGIKRKVLKVWMHNNKHNYATKKLNFVI